MRIRNLCKVSIALYLPALNSFNAIMQKLNLVWGETSLTCSPYTSLVSPTYILCVCILKLSRERTLLTYDAERLLLSQQYVSMKVEKISQTYSPYINQPTDTGTSNYAWVDVQLECMFPIYIITMKLKVISNLKQFI